MIKGDEAGQNGIIEYEPEVAEKVGKSRERVILFNPLQIQGTTPKEKVMDMWLLACHEITHFFAGSHDELFTSCERAVQQASLPVLGEIEQIGQAAFGKSRPFVAKKRSGLADALPQRWDKQVERLRDDARERFEKDYNRYDTARYEAIDDWVAANMPLYKEQIETRGMEVTREDMKDDLEFEVTHYRRLAREGKAKGSEYNAVVYGAKADGYQAIMEALFGKRAIEEAKQPKLELSLMAGYNVAIRTAR